MSPTEERSRSRRQRAEERPIEERVADVEWRMREIVILLRVVTIVATGNLAGRILDFLTS